MMHPNHKREVLILIFSMTLLMNLTAQNFTGGYHFNLPADDATEQRFLPQFPAEEIQSFVTINPDGHFAVGDEPIRFWGVNFTTNACFPVKEKSPFIAARMRKMGINLVRFHHMDNGWTGNEGTIFIRGSGNTRALDPVALDRLLFLLSEMKKNGVYANLNLHVSRTFLEDDGVPGADSIYQFAKGITYYDPHLITLQKEFARQLLTAENPYTALALHEDPVIAMVEITNENTLYGMWKGDQLKHFSDGGNLMQRHAKMLDVAWQDFLVTKYQGQSALEDAWGGQVSAGQVENQIQDGGFEANDINSNWDLELHNTAQASFEATDETSWEGQHSAKVTVTQVTNTAWHIQFQQDGMSMQKDSNYILQFYAKADRARPINAALQRDVDPWTWYGGQNFNLTTDWQKFQLTVTAIEDNNGVVRATFNFMNEPGVVWFDNVSFAKPLAAGLEAGEDLASRNIRRMDYSERLTFHPQRVRDMAQFYLQIQRNYYREMYDFLKNEIGVKVPITGTNALVGPADVFMQQDLDYIDDHAYWNHPRFPNEAWSTTDWFIDNESLLNHAQMGTISGLFGGLAMEGKPYTISEYNHPFPNRYHYEMFPVLAAHASYHDADGLMFFQYHGGSNDNWEEDFIPGFFGIHRNHSLMAMSPVFGYAYRAHLIPSTNNVAVIDYDSTSVFQMALDDNLGRWGTYYPYDPLASAQTGIRTAGFTAESISMPTLSAPNGSVFTSDNRTVVWDVDRRIHSINTQQLQGFTGDLAGLNDEELQDLKLVTCSDEGVIAWISLDDHPLIESKKSLLCVTSRIQNTGMQWLNNNTVRDQWGRAPTEILALKADLQLKISADSVHIYPLDEIGSASDFFTIFPDDQGRFNLQIDQNMQSTPWFGIETFGITTSVEEVFWESNLTLMPNPTAGQVSLSWHEDLDIESVQLINQLGQPMKNWPVKTQSNIIIDISELPMGIYYLGIQKGNLLKYKKLVKL